MLYNIIRSYDALSKNVHFTLNDKKYVSTFIGGLLSVIICVITIAILILFIVDMDNNKNIFVNEFIVNDSTLHITHSNFPFAFNISNDNFNIKISYYLNKHFYNEIGYQPCSNSGIVNDSNWLCPSNFSNDINNDNHYYITIELSNKTDINEEVTLSFMYMNVYYNNLYNDNNRYDFVYEFINDTYTITNKEMNIEYDIYQKQIEEDNNLIIHSVKKSSAISIYNITKTVNDSNESKITITLKASNKRMIMYVNHNFNLFYVLSLVGGISNFLSIICTGVLYAYERTHTNVEILNSIFDFSSYNSSKKLKENNANNSFLFQSNIKNEKKENESKDKIKLTENKSDLKTSDIYPTINVMELTNINMKDNFKAKNQMINCTDNFDLRLKKLILLKQIKANSLNRLLKFSLCESLHVYCCCSLTKTFNSKKKLYTIKLREVNSLLALSRYFEQANTIDKIINVLLGKGQRGVLSLLSRDLIYKALERNKVDLLNDEVSFENHIMKYANKIKDINYNRTCIDKRIIKIIDKINLI